MTEQPNLTEHQPGPLSSSRIVGWIGRGFILAVPHGGEPRFEQPRNIPESYRQPTPPEATASREEVDFLLTHYAFGLYALKEQMQPGESRLGWRDMGFTDPHCNYWVCQ